MTARGKTA